MREAGRSRSGERGRGVRGGVRALPLAALLAALALASLLVAASASAQGPRGHVFGGTIGAEGSGDGQLKEPAGIAVSEATGAVYVVDAGNNRIVEFEPEGAPGEHKYKFARTWGWGVQNGAKEFQICTSGCRAGLAGHAKGALHGANAIAIDQNTNKALDPSAGDIYVETVTPYEEEVEGKEKIFEHTVIEKYQPNGEPTAKGNRIKGFKEKGSSTELFEEEVFGLTVGVGGKLYVYNEQSVIKYSNAEVNTFEALIALEFENFPGLGLAVDNTGEILYAGQEGSGHGEVPNVFTKELVIGKGEAQETEPLIEALTNQNSTGIAVDEANNEPIVDNVETVGVFDPNGEQLERIGQGHLKKGAGIAATRAGDIYVADAGTGQVVLFPGEPEGPPKIDELSVAEIASESATLGAEINPAGALTTFSFRYSTAPIPAVGEACTGVCVEVPVAPGGEVGKGFGDISVPAQALSGLAPSTQYYYAAIARSANAPAGVESAQQSFRTQPTVLGKVLPDNRRWELVSPADKNGASLEAQNLEGGLIEASEAGTRLTYVGTGALPGAEGNRAPEPTQVVAARGATEWASTDIDPPQSTGKGVSPGGEVAYRAFSPELETVLLRPYGTAEAPPLAPEVTNVTPYVRSTVGNCLAPSAQNFVEKGCFSPLFTKNIPAEVEIEGVKHPNQAVNQVNVVSATPDLSHIVLTTNAAALSNEPVGPHKNLFEYYEGAAHLASILPNGEPAGVKTSGESPELGLERNWEHAISANGTRIFFTTAESGPRHLYMRDMAKGETIQIDTPEAEAETKPQLAHPRFQLANVDGSRVFFTDEQRLTKNSTAVSSNEWRDLYVCEISENQVSHKLECKLTDLTVDPLAGKSAEVQGLALGAGEAGNEIFFVVNGKLSPEGANGTCSPSEEQSNEGAKRLSATCDLYVVRYDAESHSWLPPHFIATLSEEDSNDWNETFGASTRVKMTSHVSLSGNYLTFVSDRSLTGYHNLDVHSGRPDTEVFQYNEATEHLTCVSCHPYGARPTGTLDTEFVGEGRGLLVDRPLAWRGRWLSGTIPTWTHVALTAAPYESRVLLNDGREFFTSAEGLVPQDKNGKEDVYEYEPAGIGGCTSESETFNPEAGGCVSLISSGASDRESTFLDASATGNDAFILTEAKLTAADTDTNFDVYDATVCGQQGFPECLPEPMTSKPPCEALQGEKDCRESATEPGTQFAAPASRNANGSTNSSSVEVLGFGPTPETNAQKLARALAACKKISSRGKRASCVRTAIFKYGTKAQKLSASLKSCHGVKNHKKRKSCEAKAHKRYGTAKKAAHGAQRSGR